MSTRLTWLLAALVPTLMASECDIDTNEVDPLPIVAGQIVLGLGIRQGCPSYMSYREAQGARCADHLHSLGPNGQPLSSPGAASARALPSQVAIDVYTASILSGPPCFSGVTQTDEDGRFSMLATGCTVEPGTNFVVLTRAHLRYTFQRSGDNGTVYAVWPHLDAEKLWDETGSNFFPYEAQSTLRNGEGVDYDVPVLLAFNTGTVPDSLADGGFAFDAGLLEVKLGGDPLGYFSEILNAWATVVELHRQMHAELGDDAWRVYPPTTGWTHSDGSAVRRAYLVRVDDDEMTANAGYGYMQLQGPAHPIAEDDAGNPFGVDGNLSDSSVLGHELGHSIQAALIERDSSVVDFMSGQYRFASRYRWSDDEMVGSGAPAAQVAGGGHHFNQLQELATATVEGSATTIGEVLVSGCAVSASWRSPVGLSNDWLDMNLNGETCAARTRCSEQNLRWHLHRRGITESADPIVQAARMTLIRDDAVANDQGSDPWVTSYNEIRVAELGCDLIDADDSDGHLGLGTSGDVVTGRVYPRSWGFHLGERLDGQASVPGTSTYPSSAADVPTESAEIGLDEYLDALIAVADADAAETSFGAAYNAQRLDLDTSPWSPQAMVGHLVDTGAITAQEGETALIHNFMEHTVP